MNCTHGLSGEVVRVDVSVGLLTIAEVMLSLSLHVYWHCLFHSCMLYLPKQSPLCNGTASYITTASSLQSHFFLYLVRTLACQQLSPHTQLAIASGSLLLSNHKTHVPYCNDMAESFRACVCLQWLERQYCQ